MAQQASEERQHRRWLEDARKYLGRGDLEATLAPLLRLPPELREEFLPRGAALFRDAVQKQHRRGDWGMLATLAARADAEPRLVEQGVGLDEAQATWWPLVWAAGRAREWARSQRLWQSLVPTAREKAPRLSVAMEAWIVGQGVPAPESVAAVLECLPPVDLRLGIEPVRLSPNLRAPRSVEEVEGAVLALCAMEPFTVFSSRVEAWAREASAEVIRAVWQLTGQLAARELWLRATAGKGFAAYAEPASLLARAARGVGDPQVLSVQALQALRVVTGSLPLEGLARAEDAEGWCSLAQAIALQPDMRPWVMRAASEVRFSGAALPQALRLYEALLDFAPDAPIWARALLAWDEHKPEARSAPEWLQKGLRELIATQVPSLLAWLKALKPSESNLLVECVASTYAPELVESWVEGSWELADEELRRVLSGAISVLLDRSRNKQAVRKMERLVRGALDSKDAARLVIEQGIEQLAATVELSAEGLRIWRRFGSRMLTYRAEFLEEAVRQAASEAEAWEVAERYLQARAGDPAYIDVLLAMDGGGQIGLARRVLGRWVERRSEDVQALAKAALSLGSMEAPCEYLHPMLEALLRTLEGQPQSARTAEVLRALALARDHGVRLRKRRAPRKKKEPANPEKEPAPRRKRKPRTQEKP
ncbi:DUF6109 family natural product biosynthesis protein [Hyalangium versicolor]|uniref:DUF6109 family natural product biosynthesis protein n=1 Tax=Hyalangium versicolor TaxID=2861190 RepID=UPI001CCD5D45|nr:DUF6109 family natural product biosynthesis protein [Hyalangium versicolor]